MLGVPSVEKNHYFEPDMGVRSVGESQKFKEPMGVGSCGDLRIRTSKGE